MATTETFQSFLDRSLQGIRNGEHYRYNFTISQLAFYPEIRDLEDREKVQLLLYLLEGYEDYSGKQPEDVTTLNTIRLAFIKQMMRAKLDLSDREMRDLLDKMPIATSIYGALYWPVGAMVDKIEKKCKKAPPTELMQEILQEIRAVLQDTKAYGPEEKKRIQLIERINALLHDGDEHKPHIQPVYFPGNDELKEFADETIAAFEEDERAHWYPLIKKSEFLSGSKPSVKFLKETAADIAKIGGEKFIQTVNALIRFVAQSKIKERTITYASGQQRSYYDFFENMNMEVMKGFVWMSIPYQNGETIQLLAALAERCYNKIPGRGPAAASLGNAGIFALYESKTMEGIAQLSRLKLRIKQNNTQKLIENYLREAAAAKNMTIHEIEDLAVDDFDLENDRRTWDFDGYHARLQIAGIGKTELGWYKPDGTPQKSVPAFVKEKYAAELKEIKAIARQIEQTLSAQRDRIDRMFRSKRQLAFEDFMKLYIGHGLMGYITRKLIWNFESNGETKSAILLNGQWTTSEEKTMQPGDDAKVSLWHPALCTVAEIKAWRDFLMRHQVSQPIRQAYREVYWLTDAEVNTRSYSNRMAAHILKQHQFNSLAKTRGWSYSLIGAYDDGRSNEAAEVALPDYGLRAAYWINEVNMDDGWNDTGIWNYVATDQVRFTDTSTARPVNLIDVAPVAFSEVMRDVDLFVGVASVGNDPEWQDKGGEQQYRDYWTAYSFGNLSEVAKTRKEILTGLIPRLKIAKVTEITDRFVVVKGKHRTYKIHIGSTNILMEPNDQYLCIVADRGKKSYTENLFLPFEGDNGLSIILSKAFMLADDDKITDTTITSQIFRN